MRSAGNTPDAMMVTVNTPGGSVRFPVPILKMQQFSLDAIFEKKLYFLLPFYIFTQEKQFREYEKNPEKLEELKRQYEDMLDRMDRLVETGNMTAYEQLTIIDMSKRVLNSIARKYDKVREGVHAIMGGRVLDHPAKRIYNEGLEQGLEQGIEKGEERERIANIRNLMDSFHMTAEQVMTGMKIPVSEQRKYMSML